MRDQTVTWTITAVWRVPMAEDLPRGYLSRKVQELHEQLPRMMNRKPRVDFKIAADDLRQWEWNKRYRP